MDAIATFSPAGEQLFDMFRKLSADDQERVREAFAAAEDDEDDIPEDHLKILLEREARYAAGLCEDIPAEEAFRQIREMLRKEQAGTP